MFDVLHVVVVVAAVVVAYEEEEKDDVGGEGREGETSSGRRQVGVFGSRRCEDYDLKGKAKKREMAMRDGTAAAAQGRRRRRRRRQQQQQPHNLDGPHRTRLL